MRAQLGAFEFPLGSPTHSDDTADAQCYAFDLTLSDEKLHVGVECTLRCSAGEQPVKIRSIGAKTLVLQCARAPDPTNGPCVLVVYPWFLYQRLLTSLRALGENDAFFPTSALRLFGKAPVDLSHGTGPQLNHEGLNSSQRSAVDLCCRSNLAFVWGPPGTGKTSTVAPILAEMLARGHRTLVVSTTHVAVDQALEKLMAHPAAQEALAHQRIARIGQASSTPAPATISALVATRHAAQLEQIRFLRSRHQVRSEQFEECTALNNALSESIRSSQLGLFSQTAAPNVNRTRALGALLGPHRARRLVSEPPERLTKILEVRSKRLQLSILLHEESISTLRQRLLAGEREIAERALVIFATISAAHINRLLAHQRFDVVVIEEAGMAVLPPLFYCAALAASKVIAVGDPRQLPPIVQSNEPFVQRAMGRNIFSIAGADRAQNPSVRMLKTQYRMHPHIGRLISALYYEHGLEHDPTTAARTAIADRAPFPGSALVLADTGGKTACESAGRHSRLNRASAAIACSLATGAAAGGIRSIAIVTPYSEQAKYIRSLIGASGHGDDAIECSTVHRFQGQERDLVIFDTADAAPMKPGILLNNSAGASNLINVSLSRARGKLIVLSDMDYFIRRAPKSEVARLLRTMRTLNSCHYATVFTPDHIPT